MYHAYPLAARAAHRSRMALTGGFLPLLALLLAWLLPGAARAQAPAWSAALAANHTNVSGTSAVRATAVNAAGDVFITGNLTGQVSFGSTTLTSLGGNDLFVAKWNTAAGTWAWALNGGGISSDFGYGIAVSGTSVYVTGSVVNNAANANNVLLGGTSLPGASTTLSADVLLAKFTDAGSSATFGWARVGGGTGTDQGQALAVSGTSVYVTGVINNNLANTNSVQFAGTAVPGASTTSGQDVLLAKFTDTGSSATFGWAQVGGGTFSDNGYGVAVSGSSVYVAGFIQNDMSNSTAVRFGGTTVLGATVSITTDVLLAKYTDNGTSATFGWATVGGGIGNDQALGLAVSGSSLYLTGFIQNNTADDNVVQFDGNPLAGASTTATVDVMLVKYTDTGTYPLYRWGVAGGGISNDQGQGVAVSGSSVYLTGNIQNNNANVNTVQFGGVALNGASTTDSQDMVVAKYTDNGASATYAWAVAAGGTSTDQGLGIAATATGVHVGFLTGSAPARYGPVIAGISASGRGVLDPATGAWQNASAPRTGNGTTQARATAVNAAGDVFITGNLTGQVNFGSTTLASIGSNDLFVAKWNTAAGAWAWAASGGGAGSEQGNGIALSGSSVYVTGGVLNTITNANGVQFGSTVVAGASTASSQDLLLAKYTDNGSSATLGWITAVGGTNVDQGQGVAVSGSSVYVTGYITNNTTNTNNVQFGGAAVPGNASTAGQDVVLAKYTDNGASATFGWARVGGGTSTDQGLAVAVSGSNVYVTGYITNTTANTNSVQFGGTALAGASGTASADVVLAKYTDNGASATFGWAQVGGGTSTDQGNGIAVSGSSVYVAGSIFNSTTNANSVQFSGTAVPGNASTAGQDLVLAKYTDNGASATFGWARVGGGIGADQGLAVAANGSSVYVTGYITNNTTNTNNVQFGGTTVAGASSTAGQDVLLAKYTDDGASATFGWARVGGGTSTDQGLAVTVSGSSVYVAGYAGSPASFGSTTFTFGVTATAFVAYLVDAPVTTLTGVSPSAELPGQVVTLTGTGFTGASTVSFGGTAAASVTVVSATQLTATVPAGLAEGSGPVSVTTGASTSTSQPFSVLAVYDGGPVGSCTPAVPATASLNDGAWHYLLSSTGQVVAAYNYSGPSLGNLAIELLRADAAQPVRQDPRNRAYLDRNWHLSSSAGRFDGRSVGLRLYGLAAEQARLQAADPVATLAGLKATQYSGANEDCQLANNVASDEHRTLAAGATQPAGTGYFVAELTVADHFSEFYLTGSAAPLPVALTQFTATTAGPNAVRLAWATASEQHSRQFEVERSLDGIRFARLGTVAAAGNSSSARAYGFDDNQVPKTLSPQVPLYYRLRQVDADGTFSYSPVCVVTLQGAAGGLALYPNPAHGAATLLGATPGTVVTVHDALGRPVAAAVADATGTAALAGSCPVGLAPGLYLVRAGAGSLRLVVE